MAAMAAMDAARLAAVMVRVHGPDPKGRKMRRHAFFHSESGDTTLSASGFLVPCVMNIERAGSSTPGHADLYETTTSPEPAVVVITCASIVEPFLVPKSHGISSQDFPKLIRGAEVDILVEVPDISQNGLGCSEEHSVRWLPSELLTVVDVPAAGAALQGLLDVHGGNVKGVWEVGWALAPVEDNAQQLHSLLTSEVLTDSRIQEDSALQHDQQGDKRAVSHAVAGVSRLGIAAAAATKIAILSVGKHGDNSALNYLKKFQQVSGLSKMANGHVLAEPKKRGDSLIAVGSPFGALSPVHFQNSISVGIVSNLWPPARGPPSLLMADVRCLPGMEGGPVFDEGGNLVGMLTRPLRQRGGAAEVQLVMTTDVLLPVLQRVGIIFGVPCATKLLDDPLQSGASVMVTENAPRQTQPCRPGGHPRTYQTMPSVPSAVEHAVASVVLITIEDGAWASGIILNKTGLILTNAHLLEPWRFVRTEIASSPVKGSIPQEAGSGKTPEGPDLNYLQQVEKPKGISASGVSLSTEIMAQKNYRRIRVRLDHRQPRSWHAARLVYVSQGPLDIALLQLESPPPDLCPITPEKECPGVGSTAVVLGYGLFGPRSELCPSASVGVVAKVVKECSSPYFTGLGARMEGKASKAAMIQTTAAVHPGGSGGAVVNAEGRMIGLATSNARHSGGTVIPFLNFSIPYAALLPVFDFASGVNTSWGRLEELDKPNEHLATVWALVPASPPLPSPLPFSSRQPFSPISQGMDAESGRQMSSRFGEFLKNRGGRRVWNLPHSSLLPYEPTQHISRRPHDVVPTYAARPSYAIHSRL